LRAWLEDYPDDALRWSRLGLLLQQLGRDDEALQAYENATARTEPDAVLANNMAWLYLERNPARAVELATKAYELAPSRAEIVDTYGWVLYKTGREREGLAALQQALIIAPRNPEIALHVGEALLGLQRASEARPILERIVREREHPRTEFAETANRLLARL
jgi:Flp pilus assembly protein TadD